MLKILQKCTIYIWRYVEKIVHTNTMFTSTIGGAKIEKMTSFALCRVGQKNCDLKQIAIIFFSRCDSIAIFMLNVQKDILCNCFTLFCLLFPRIKSRLFKEH